MNLFYVTHCVSILLRDEMFKHTLVLNQYIVLSATFKTSLCVLKNKELHNPGKEGRDK